MTKNINSATPASQATILAEKERDGAVAVHAQAEQAVQTASSARAAVEERLAAGDATVTADELIQAQAAENKARHATREAGDRVAEATRAFVGSALAELEDSARRFVAGDAHTAMIDAGREADEAKAKYEELREDWDRRVLEMADALNGADISTMAEVSGRKPAVAVSIKWQGDGWPVNVLGVVVDGTSYLTVAGEVIRAEDDRWEAQQNRFTVTVDPVVAAAYEERRRARAAENVGWVD